MHFVLFLLSVSILSEKLFTHETPQPPPPLPVLPVPCRNATDSPRRNSTRCTAAAVYCYAMVRPKGVKMPLPGPIPNLNRPPPSPTLPLPPPLHQTKATQQKNTPSTHNPPLPPLPIPLFASELPEKTPSASFPMREKAGPW